MEYERSRASIIQTMYFVKGRGVGVNDKSMVYCADLLGALFISHCDLAPLPLEPKIALKREGTGAVGIRQFRQNDQQRQCLVTNLWFNGVNQYRVE